MSDSRPITLVCPSPNGWVAWQRSEEGTWSQTGEAGIDAKPWELIAPKHPWVLGLTVRSIQTLALRLPQTEGTRLEDVIPLRLEAIGMTAGIDGAVLADWEVAAQSPERRNITVWAVEPNALDGCPSNKVPSLVVPSMARWNWGARDLVFWCEAGRWVVAFTADSFPVHVQPCTATEDVAALASDVRGQAMALLLRGLTQAPQRIVVRGTGAVFAEALAKELDLPIVELPELPENLPTKSRIICKEMLAARQSKIEAARWRQRLTIAALVWFGLASYGAWTYMQAKNELAGIQASHDSVIPKAEALSKVQEASDMIISAVSVEAFPLEILSRLTKTMPPADFRLTTFTVEGDRDVFLKGSAKRPDLALRFAQDLRRDKNLSAYTWETPYPVNEKDGTATFTYQGKFRMNTP